MSREPCARNEQRAEAPTRQNVKLRAGKFEPGPVAPHSAEKTTRRSSTTHVAALPIGHREPAAGERDTTLLCYRVQHPRDPEIASMSGQIVPKRFGLKYAPKPAIALEYQKPDSGVGGK